MKIFKLTAEVVSRINNRVYNNTYRILDRLESHAADGYSSNLKEIKPFYNKFLPKILRRTTSVEFYPNSSQKKLEMVFDNNRVMLKAEQFDEAGNSIYFETFNPFTKRGFVRMTEDGLKVEKSFVGSVLRKMKKYDGYGNVVYLEKYNPKTKIKKILSKDPLGLKKEVYHGDELINKSERYIDGSIYEEGFFPETGLRYSQMGERIRNKSGKLSKKSKLSTLEIKNSDGSRMTIERKNTGETTYYQKHVFDTQGKEIEAKARNINSEQVHRIIEAVKSGKLTHID